MVHGDRHLWAEHDGSVWQYRLFNGSTMEEAELTDTFMGEECGRFFHGGCDRFTVFLEDTILVMPPDTRTLVAFDTITGITHRVEDVPDNQIIAMLVLSVGGDEVANSDEYYDIIAPLLVGWPNECRPVP